MEQNSHILKETHRMFQWESFRQSLIFHESSRWASLDHLLVFGESVVVSLWWAMVDQWSRPCGGDNI